MAKDLGKNDWLKAARVALLKGGVEAVRVERLARDLHVTKGSFYWHFKGRSELLQALLLEWETETVDLLAQLGNGSTRTKLLKLARVLVDRARLSEEGDVPSDAAIFAWASVSPKVAERVNRTERARIKLLSQISGRGGLTELFYLAWLGFVARGQRVPESRRRFPAIAQMLLGQLLPTQPGARRTSRAKLSDGKALPREPAHRIRNRA
jgi:AcrR family transcriptional regulator